MVTKVLVTIFFYFNLQSSDVCHGSFCNWGIPLILLRNLLMLFCSSVNDMLLLSQ